MTQALRPTPEQSGSAANGAGADRESVIAIVADNSDAFAVRALAAREATRTLDMMYYIWHDDHCGNLLVKEVVAAADRGVKVRLLIDDMNPQVNDANYLQVDGHPNIELKLFNPSGCRDRGLFRGLEIVARLTAMTRRMHCKAWIADSRLAIVGGRNIGDEYFDAAETNFRDIDLVMTGPVARQACSVFERYWTYGGSVAIGALNPARRRGKLQRRNRSDLDIEQALGPSRTMAEFMADRRSLRIADTARLIADPPEKIEDRHRENWLLEQIRPLIQASSDRVEIISPYFVPGKLGTQALTELVNRGVSATVVTNSLAATDVAVVHGGYANYRRRLLRSGVKLFEFQRAAEGGKMSVLGSKGASLHTKSFTVDDRFGFVGSFNFDPRSVSLNTEMGVVFECGELVRELRELFVAETSPQRSYRVSLDNGRLRWDGEDEDGPQSYSSEPRASLRRRLVAFVMRWLPIESQL